MESVFNWVVNEVAIMWVFHRSTLWLAVGMLICFVALSREEGAE